jgi:hypothetical protein
VCDWGGPVGSRRDINKHHIYFGVCEAMNFPKVEKKDIPDEILVRRVAHKIKIGDQISCPDPLSEYYDMMSLEVRTIDHNENQNIITFNTGDPDGFSTGTNDMVELISGSLIEE